MSLPTFRCPLSGDLLTVHDLPDPNKPLRWTVRRKATLIRAIESGSITEGLVLTRYKLSPEELNTWRKKFSNGDLEALKVKNIQ